MNRKRYFPANPFLFVLLRNALAVMLLLSLLVTSCATPGGSRHKGSGRGIYHIVERGQTLYRIAKTYGVELDLVIRVNSISNPHQIDTGQVLFIPGADRRLHVDPYWVYTGAAPALPVSGKITSRFGAPRSGYLHTGLDIAAPEGSPIHAALAGTVSFSGRQSRYGNIVIIEHSGGYTTIYAHNQQNLVRRGERVSRGQLIAKVGSSGNATGSHVHFEVRRNGAPVNPEPFLKAKN